MGLESLNILMEMYIKESLERIRRMEKEFFMSKMENLLRVFGRITS